MPDAITEWFAALRRGDVPAVERALAADPGIGRAGHETGLSSVTWACYCRQWAVVALLLATAPELDLFEAVAAGDEALARSLLVSDASLATAWSADPGACAEDGRAAADFADERKHHALAARLREGSPGA